jgi:hypothetical protein
MAICGLRRFSNALPQRCELAKTGDPQARPALLVLYAIREPFALAEGGYGPGNDPR